MSVLPKLIVRKTALPTPARAVELRVRSLPSQRPLAKSVASTFSSPLPTRKPTSPLSARSTVAATAGAAALGTVMQRLPEAKVYETHIVRHGEDLDSVAASYAHMNVSAAEIAAANRLEHFKVPEGTELTIPGPELRLQPQFQAAVAYYQGEYKQYSQRYGAADRTLGRGRPRDVGISTSQANQQNLVTDFGMGSQTTVIHLDKREAALQAKVDAQRNADAAKAQAEAQGAGARRGRGTEAQPKIARMANVGNTAEGRLVPTRIELDKDKATAHRHAVYEHEKAAFAMGATDKGLWGNTWEMGTHRYHASLLIRPANSIKLHTLRTCPGNSF